MTEGDRGSVTAPTPGPWHGWHMSEPWSCRHIRLSNPAGPGERDVPRLLRAVADLLERIGDDIEILDLGLKEDDHPDGPWTAMNIYYRRGEPRRARPQWGD